MARARALGFAFALALASALVAPPARAAGSYDPDATYQTLETPHYAITAPVELAPLARRVAEIAERYFPYLARRYGHTPSGRTAIVLNDQIDTANGSATIFPNKLVTLYLTPPTELSGLQDYDDWLELLVLHELTHVFHLDMTGGLPEVGRWVLGKYAAMTQYAPAWVTEGLAVYEETRSTGAGRGRSSYVDMFLRTAALADTFPTVDRGFRGLTTWPFTNVAYFFGGRFQLWLSERYGEAALMRYHQAYAKDPIPYLSWLPAEIAFGATIEQLWATFTAEQRADAELTRRLLEAEGPLTEARRLTRYGGELAGARFAPDGGSIVFSTSSPKDGPRIRRIQPDGSGDEVFLNDTFSRTVSFAPDGRSFVCAQTEINQRFYAHNHLLRFDVATQAAERLVVTATLAEAFVAPSGSLRARDPDLSPDGRAIVFVQSFRGENRLVYATIADDGRTLTPRVIVPASLDLALSSPRFSPDGRAIAVTVMRGGRRDVELLSLDGGARRAITADRAQDADPSFSPDGRWLVFTSDRTGIFELYALDLTGALGLRRLTRTITGAFQPLVSPDGATLVFRGYAADGFDLYAIPFAPEAAPEVSRAPASAGPVLSVAAGLEIEDVAGDVRTATAVGVDGGVRAASVATATASTGVALIGDPDALVGGADALDGLGRLALRGAPTEPTVADALAASPAGVDGAFTGYTPWATLLPFHDNWNLLPSLQVNEREAILQASTSGQDALETQAYVGWLSYRTGSRTAGGGFAYAFDALEPTFTLRAETYVRSVPLFAQTARVVDADGRGLYYDERIWDGFVGVSLPLLQRHLIRVGYRFEHRVAEQPLDPAIAALATNVPRAGNYARVTLGYTYQNVRFFPHSISLERGVSFAAALEGLARGLGSDVEQLVVTAEGRGFWTVPLSHPWLQNHVLAGRLGLALGIGAGRSDLFFAGGVLGSSALSTSTRGFFPLRGAVTAGISGPALISGSVEYRAPIWRVERGLGTVPLALRVLHLAVFGETARALPSFDVDTRGGVEGALSDFFGGFTVGAGAELRADVLVGYVLELELRLGYGALVAAPQAGLAANGPFFQIGSTY